ncbi:Mitochondrial distribution and morphology protein 31 [Smittium culicis]|uniref:Mitochondrial distribution and morphology protein 31 n=1 Tax=Smittium culicis TaxID=133412 RepID=A0A1R1YP24_9FUNG|nr:Mitochondrial distribution and morphology protein 31 [Smittium culicis]
MQNKLVKSNILSQHDNKLKRFFVHVQFVLKGTSTGRPWTLDDRLALGSWIILSNIMWIIVGTTTFVSVVLFILNQLNLQSAVSVVVSRYMSKAIGISIIIDSTIFPKWKNGKITLKNINIECGPQHAIINPANSEIVPDLNFTYYKLKVDEVDVDLSLVRWIDGKGIVSNCKFSGIRGFVDRRHVVYDYSVPYIPENDRILHRPGYFDFDSVEVEDISITLLNPDVRPINISIYNASLDKLRQQWFFYDILNANSIVGIYDTSLFSIRQLRQTSPQTNDIPLNKNNQIYSSTLHNSSFFDTNIQLDPETSFDQSIQSRAESKSTINQLKKKLCTTHNTTEIKVDNLAIAHLNHGVEGPVGWINSGNVDINATILLPNPNCIGYNPTEIIHKIITDLATSIDVVILPSSNDWLDPEFSDSLLVRILHNSGALESKTAEFLKNRVEKKFESEANRRLDLQRKRTKDWEQSSNNVRANIQPVRNSSENLGPVSTNQTNEFDTQNSETSAEPTPNFGNDPNLEFSYPRKGDYSSAGVSPEAVTSSEKNSRFVFIDLQFGFNNIRANVPLTTPHLSYLNSTLLIRPILAYMNSHRVRLPIRCQLRMDIENFDGSWNAYDSDLVYLVSDGIGEAFARMVVDQKERTRRLKQIGLWSVAEVAKQLTLFLEYVTGFKGFWQYLGNTATIPGVSIFC